MTRPHTRDRQLPQSRDLQKVPLLGLVSSFLTEVGLPKMAPPRSAARPCQGLEGFQMLKMFQTVGWGELAFTNMGPSRGVSR